MANGSKSQTTTDDILFLHERAPLRCSQFGKSKIAEVNAQVRDLYDNGFSIDSQTPHSAAKTVSDNGSLHFK